MIDFNDFIKDYSVLYKFRVSEAKEIYVVRFDATSGICVIIRDLKTGQYVLTRMKTWGKILIMMRKVGFGLGNRELTQLEQLRLEGCDTRGSRTLHLRETVQRLGVAKKMLEIDQEQVFYLEGRRANLEKRMTNEQRNEV